NCCAITYLLTFLSIEFIEVKNFDDGVNCGDDKNKIYECVHESAPRERSGMPAKMQHEHTLIQGLFSSKQLYKRIKKARDKLFYDHLHLRSKHKSYSQTDDGVFAQEFYKTMYRTTHRLAENFVYNIGSRCGIKPL